MLTLMFLPRLTSQNLTNINGKTLVVRSDFVRVDSGSASVTILVQFVEVRKNL